MEYFLKLVKINAESKKERLIADYLKQELKKLGCTVQEDNVGMKIGGNAGNIIARLQGDKAGNILFCAHMDRVEPGKNIKPQIDNGIITSDGTTILAADDLAGVAAILAGIAKVTESGQEHSSVEIVFSVCEEQAILGSKYLDYSQLHSKYGFVLDTSGHIGRIVNKAPNKGIVTIKVFGKASHAGNFPERGVNAIMAAAHILDGLKEGRLGPEATANFGSIYGGGDNIGTVCDSVVIRGEIRNHDLAALYKYYEYVKDYCAVRIKDTKATFTIDFDLNYKGFYVKENDPMMRFLLTEIGKMNITSHIETGMGGMDANNFNANGIRAVGVAIGYSDPHALQESIVMDDLTKAGELVYRLIMENC